MVWQNPSPYGSGYWTDWVFWACSVLSQMLPAVLIVGVGKVGQLTPAVLATGKSRIGPPVFAVLTGQTACCEMMPACCACSRYGTY